MELSKKDIDFLVSILKKYIDTSLATITNRGRIKVHHFEEQYMRTVNGGLPLDQSLFRTYLQTCGKVNVWIDSDKTGELPTDGDQDVLYFLWVDGSYVMYIYTDMYVLITTTTQIDDLNVSGATTYSSQKIVSLIVTTSLGMSYSNLISGLQSTNVQDAIDELKVAIDTPLSIEHDQTRDKNGNPDFLHATQAQHDRWTNNYTFKLENKEVNTWAESTAYVGYGFQAQILIANLTENDLVSVVFSGVDVISGNYYPTIEIYEGYILVFSKVNTTITIPTIEITKIYL